MNSENVVLSGAPADVQRTSVLCDIHKLSWHTGYRLRG
jgi:hypothetical protein